MEKSKKTLINRLGLLGVVSFLSYAAAVVFSPLAYPGYDWMSQAVSDLSAANAPSRVLWNQITTGYAACTLICVMMVSVMVQSKFNKILRIGIYLFAAMNWVSMIGFSLFPLSESGIGGTTFQDTMHIVITVVVVLLSIASLTMIVGGLRKREFVSLGVCAAVALFLMFVGAIGVNAAPREYFGVFQRFSNLISANGFLAVLGIYLFTGKFGVMPKINNRSDSL